MFKSKVKYKCKNKNEVYWAKHIIIDINGLRCPDCGDEIEEYYGKKKVDK